MPRRSSLRPSHLPRSDCCLQRSRLTYLQHTLIAIDQLPQELIDRICRNLDVQDLESTLLLSRKFQFSSKKFSGIFTWKALTASTAQKFVDTYSSHRLLYLRHVEFRPTLPRLQQLNEKISCQESQGRIRMRGESFSRQIRCLFTTLKTGGGSHGEMYPGSGTTRRQALRATILL